MQSTVFLEADFLFEILNYIYDIFARLGSFAMTDTGVFLDYCAGTRNSIDYIYRSLNLFNEQGAYLTTFSIDSDTFLGTVVALVGNVITLIIPSGFNDMPLFVSILFGCVEWYLIISVGKFLLGLL